MKKVILGSLISLTLVGGAFVGIRSMAKADEINQTIQSQYKISKENAKEIAFKHSGVKEADTTNLKIKLDLEDGVAVYEVEFNVGKKEYDYDIHATKGTIISYDVDLNDDNDLDDDINLDDDIDLDDDINPVDDNDFDDDINPDDDKDFDDVTTSNQIISKTEAKKIVLAKLPGATDNQIRIHLDKEDGQYVYEGSILYDNLEYEFEIDAKSGDLKEWDIDE